MGAGIRKLVCYESDDNTVLEGGDLPTDQQLASRAGTDKQGIGSPVTEGEISGLFEKLVGLSRHNSFANSSPGERWFEQSSRIEQAVHEAWYAQLLRPVNPADHRTELKMGADLATKVQAQRKMQVTFSA